MWPGCSILGKGWNRWEWDTLTALGWRAWPALSFEGLIVVSEDTKNQFSMQLHFLRAFAYYCVRRVTVALDTERPRTQRDQVKILLGPT